MTVPRYTFEKGERLRKRKDLEHLFQSDRQFFSYPFRVFYAFLDKEEFEYSVQILISIPKRKIKKANKRNLIKRRAKEAYRLHKQSLIDSYNCEDKVLAIGMVYASDKVLKYKDIEDSVNSTITILQEKL